MSADSNFMEEKEPEKFDALHPYPDIYYQDEEDIIDEEDWCSCCDNTLDECVCDMCICEDKMATQEKPTGDESPTGQSK